MLNRFKNILSNLLVGYLTSPVKKYEPFSVSSPEALCEVLQPADILLVEGQQRFSVAVKYLTQSTWSHAAIYVGDIDKYSEDGGESLNLIEADLKTGISAIPLSRYKGFNTRVCRPVGLSKDDQQKVVKFMVDSIGMAYDLRNIIDLARYLIPTPIVPVRWRRRMIALGSGDPTRAICSTRIAEAFQSVQFPILPYIEKISNQRCEECKYAIQEIMHIRHHSLFTPHDFDLSPYFAIIKPTIEQGFNYKDMNWDQGRTAKLE
jgi:hypothetical protein